MKHEKPDHEPSEPDIAETAAPRDELSKCRAERDELFERVARLTADFQNSRRRLETEFDQRLQFANSALIKALIPVIDNFERALAVDPAKSDVGSVLKGLQVVHDQWLAVLKKEHVETIAPEPGEAFDPSRHEALMHEPSDRYPEHAVTRLLVKGYALHGRTLRPASVVVSKSL
jgi:molecular chaperone GrpE